MEGVDWLTVSRVEVDRPGETFTVDTLEQLKAANAGTEYVFVLGADQARRLDELARARKACCSWRSLRSPSAPALPLKKRVDAVARVGGEGRVTTFPMPRVDVSSTEVRERVATGRPYRFLVPERVAERIEREGLYR